MSVSYQDWSRLWTEARRYDGVEIPRSGLQYRIDQVIGLWAMELPSAWERDKWTFLTQRGFRRGDGANPTPEHKLEKRLFNRRRWKITSRCSSMHLFPELNEISFGNQRGGQRKIDVLAILKSDEQSRPLAIEMKGSRTNNCWFAVVENLQQLRLLHSYPQYRLANSSWLSPFENLPLSRSWGMVLAPLPFFTAPGQKVSSFRQAQCLMSALKERCGVTILLASFNDRLQGQLDVQSEN
jgi:hypothetical protein